MCIGNMPIREEDCPFSLVGLTPLEASQVLYREGVGPFIGAPLPIRQEQ